MPFIDTNELRTIERLPGWKGKYFDSESMTYNPCGVLISAKHLQPKRRFKVEMICA
jgi:hypothetical protein